MLDHGSQRHGDRRDGPGDDAVQRQPGAGRHRAAAQVRHAREAVQHRQPEHPRKQHERREPCQEQPRLGHRPGRRVHDLHHALAEHDDDEPPEALREVPGVGDDWHRLQHLAHPVRPPRPAGAAAVFRSSPLSVPARLRAGHHTVDLGCRATPRSSASPRAVVSGAAPGLRLARAELFHPARVALEHVVARHDEHEPEVERDAERPERNGHRRVGPQRDHPGQHPDGVLGDREVEEHLTTSPRLRAVDPGDDVRDREHGDRALLVAALEHGVRHAGHRRRHDTEPEHPDEQAQHVGARPRDVAVEHERRPRQPHGEEEHGIQTEGRPAEAHLEHVRQRGHAGDGDEVEEQLGPARVPFGLGMPGRVGGHHLTVVRGGGHRGCQEARLPTGPA